mgnify:CR=1 FL=1
MNKLSFSESGYIIPNSKIYPKSGKGIRCGTCYYYKYYDKFLSKGKCAIVNGEINTQGCCNLWTNTGDIEDLNFLSGKDILKKLKGNKNFKTN